MLEFVGYIQIVKCLNVRLQPFPGHHQLFQLSLTILDYSILRSSITTKVIEKVLKKNFGEKEHQDANVFSLLIRYLTSTKASNISNFVSLILNNSLTYFGI